MAGDTGVFVIPVSAAPPTANAVATFAREDLPAPVLVIVPDEVVDRVVIEPAAETPRHWHGYEAIAVPGYTVYVPAGSDRRVVVSG